VAKRIGDANVLRQHLAYEVHYLVLAARRFPAIDGRESGIYQDSAYLHARNLLEFTQPPRRPDAWWIPDAGGNTPTANPEHKAWANFINAKVSHLGGRRPQGMRQPGTLHDLATFSLQRIKSLLPQASNDDRIAIMRELADLGLAYLTSHDESKLDQISDAIDNPMPIQGDDG
jgi:hypothetical protein